MRYLLIIVLLLTFVFGDNDEHEEREHHYYNKDLTYLNLSYIQKKEIKKILKEYRKKLKKYREYKEDILEKKEDVFEKERFDSEKFMDINLKLSKEASKIEIEFLENIHQILSRKQRELFIKYIDEWEIE